MAAPLYGQLTMNGSAQRLSNPTVEISAFTIKAPSTNTLPVYIGDASVTTSTGHVLAPGDEFQYERLQQNGLPVYQLRPSDFYVVGTASDKVSWLASPAN